MYMFHTICDRRLLLDLSSSYKILAEFSILKTKLKPGMSEILKVGDELQFYCLYCKRNVTESREVYIPCNSCGKKLTVAQAYKLSNCSGIYCLECSSESDETPYQLSTILRLYLK